ncbi:MAG: GLPGLI family protein [Flavobacteriales bacterium]
MIEFVITFSNQFKAMKKYIFIAMGLVSLSLFAQGNKSYEIIYDFSYQPDSTDPASQRQEDMVLFRNDSISLFQSYVKYKRDSVMKRNTEYLKNAIHTEQGIDINTLFGGYIPKISMVIKKDFKNHKYIIQKPAGVDVYQYEEPAEVDWQIQTDTMTLSGYQCQKATTRIAGRNYAVWFTPEISIPDGPFKFFGLPGLIVQATDSQGFFQFKLKEFKAVDQTAIPELRTHKVIVTTKEKYARAKGNAAHMKINDMFKSSGIRIQISEEDERAMRKRDKKDNNPIELE